MSQFARGRRATDAQAEEEIARRLHHLQVAAQVTVMPSASAPAAAAAPAKQPQLEHENRKEKFLIGGAAPVSDAPSGRVAQLGAFADVRVEQGRDGKRTVVKTYSPTNAQVAQHLQNELALAGRLRHPNIIGPDTVSKLDDGRVEIRMEYAAGGSLADYLKRAKYSSRDGRALPGEEAGALFIGLVDAVAYLHSNELAHGDLKLSNAMLDGPIVRLIDFGTCRRAAANSTEPPLPGTLAYTSPEAVDGLSHDGRRADVWALGVSLCNLLMRGDFPFVGRGEDGLIHSIKTARPTLPDGVSEEARDLIERMLAKEPARRISIGEVRGHPWTAACAARGKGSRDPMVATDYSASMRNLLKAER